MIYNVVQYLEQSASRCPERIAFADARRSITYGELWEIVRRAGSVLAELYPGGNHPMAVRLTQSAADPIAFFSVAYSGNFYVPVDFSLPALRVKQMIETLSPVCLLVSGEERGESSEISLPTHSPEALAAKNAAVTEPWRASKDTDPLYVIFTSGSTGMPKGVVSCHRSVIDMAEGFSEVFRFPAGTVFGNQAPFYYDGSVKDLYLSLKNAGRVEILEKSLFSFPKFLIQRLNERQVDTIIWSVPALRLIESLRAFEKEVPEKLKNVLFSGEVLPPGTLRYWREHLPTARYVNLYGPTEITCNCTYFEADPSWAGGTALPIGHAFPNCSVFLLDGDSPVTKPGERGEICVTGSCLALGYYNQPELTEAAFAKNPLRPGFAERMYRTGDIGYYNAEGELVYAGRRDFQIKHMGNRIELPEIEFAAEQTGGVLAAACVYNVKRARIVLFYQPDPQNALTPASLLDALRKRLPGYMLPAVCRSISSFPMTRTGKIDRTELLKLTEE